MKVKLKSANKFTRFMLAHGEKLGMAAVLAVAGLLIWSSLGRPRLEADKQPTNLQQKATQADTHVREMRWENFDAESRTNPAEVIVKVDPKKKVVDDPSVYAIKPIEISPIPQISKRKDPELLAIEKPEASGGAGIWAMADPEVLKERMLRALEEQQNAAREAREEAEEFDDDERGGRRRRGRGGRGRDDGGDFGRGGYANFGSFGGEMTKDNVLVVRPTGGAPVQGFEDIRNTSWVVVKAKVPIRAQNKSYEDALMNSHGYEPSTDAPTYVGYEVQRAEVTDQGDGEFETVAKVVAKSIIREMEQWPIQTPDIINPKYNHPLLTYPLPPMVLRPWDESITHSELPIPTPEELMGGLEGEQDGRDEPRRDEENEEEEGDPFQGASQRPRGGGFGGEFGGRGRDDGFRGGFDGGRGGFDGGRGGFDGGRGGFDGGRGGFDGGRGGFGGFRGGGGRDDGGGGFSGRMGGGAGSVDPEMFTQFTWDGTTRYLLFRYFDTNVEPGKRYRYRVRLALRDVNAAPVPERYLDEAVIERRTKENTAFRLTPFSEPTPVAVVPQAGLVYVAGAKPANLSNLASEPEAELVIKAVDAGTASEAALGAMFTRGTVLNLVAQKAKIIWSSTFQVANNDGEPVDSPSFNFRAGQTVLDFDGGQPLNGSRDLTAPARVVLMDAGGRMTVKNELDDLKPVREYDAYMLAAQEAARDMADRERGGGGGRGGRGGGRD